MGRAGKIIGALAILAIVGFACYTGYTEKTAVESLEIELVDVAITRIGLTSCDITLRLRFYNPTDHDTPPFSLGFDIYIADHRVGHGSLPEMHVPAHSEKHGDLTITLEYAKLAEAVIDAMVRGEFTLSIVGTLKSRIIFGLIPISRPFEAYYEYG